MLLSLCIAGIFRIRNIYARSLCGLTYAASELVLIDSSGTNEMNYHYIDVLNKMHFDAKPTSARQSGGACSFDGLKRNIYASMYILNERQWLFTGFGAKVNKSCKISFPFPEQKACEV